MTYLVIVIAALMALLGGVATAQGDYAGTPFLVIGVAALVWILVRRRPTRTTGGEGGE